MDIIAFAPSQLGVGQSTLVVTSRFFGAEDSSYPCPGAFCGNFLVFFSPLTQGELRGTIY
jgi:hypothetical protein